MMEVKCDWLSDLIQPVKAVKVNEHWYLGSSQAGGSQVAIDHEYQMQWEALK